MNRATDDESQAAYDVLNYFRQVDDGEFYVPERDHPFEVIRPIGVKSRIFYLTKPKPVQLLLGDWDGSSDGLIGRRGIFTTGEMGWLKSLVINHHVCFFGDLDPPDLLIFAMMRRHIQASFIGVSDRLLTECGIRFDERIIMDQSNSEVDSMPFLSRVVPDFEELVGTHCAEILASGKKIELEALDSFRDREKSKGLCARI